MESDQAVRAVQFLRKKGLNIENRESFGEGQRMTLIFDTQGGSVDHFVQCMYTIKSILRFYGKITGNQLPVHFPLLFTGAHKHFQESGTER